MVDVKWPFDVHIFTTPFLTMHFLLALSVVLGIVGQYVTALFALGLLVFRAFIYFRRDFDIKHIVRSMAFIFLRYTINLALIAGGFLGGVKSRMLYIGATFDHVS
jgi:hypothetical protein